MSTLARVLNGATGCEGGVAKREPTPTTRPMASPAHAGRPCASPAAPSRPLARTRVWHAACRRERARATAERARDHSVAKNHDPSTPCPLSPSTADTANGALKKLYHQSAVALAALVPLAAFQQQGDALGRVIDFGLNAALPIHGHIAMNYVVTDYVPKSVAGAARWGVLAGSAIAAAGMLKLNVAGPGVTATAKGLWAREAPVKKDK